MKKLQKKLPCINTVKTDHPDARALLLLRLDDTHTPILMCMCTSNPSRPVDSMHRNENEIIEVLCTSEMRGGKCKKCTPLGARMNASVSRSSLGKHMAVGKMVGIMGFPSKVSVAAVAAKSYRQELPAGKMGNGSGGRQGLPMRLGMGCLDAKASVNRPVALAVLAPQYWQV